MKEKVSTKNQPGTAQNAAVNNLMQLVLAIYGERSHQKMYSLRDAEEAVRVLVGRSCYGISGKRFIEAWRHSSEISGLLRFDGSLLALEEVFPYLTRKERGDCLFFVKDTLKTIEKDYRPLASEIHDCLRTLVRLDTDIEKSGDELRKITGVFAKGEFESKFPAIAAATHLNESDKLRVALGLYPRNRSAGAAPSNKNAVGNRSRHKTGRDKAADGDNPLQKALNILLPKDIAHNKKESKKNDGR